MGFWSQLQRRRVINSGLAYLAVAVVVAEGAGIFLPALGVPQVALNLLLYALIAGFPLALVLSWRYDLTAHGIRRTEDLPPSDGTAEAVVPEDEDPHGADSAGARDKSGPESRAHGRVAPALPQRRQVAVLAARAHGYLRLSEGLDPEDARELTGRIAEVAEDVCRRFGGCVHRLSGEELVLLFGVPHAHEDDALRGVRAALALMDGVRRIAEGLARPDLPPMQEGCAVVSGTLLVGEDDGTGRGRDITGDPLLVAAHLSTHAGPGSVLVGQHTFRWTQGVLSYEELPPLLLEGRRDPVEIYRLVAPRAVPSTVHDCGRLQSELVGRLAEVGALMDALAGLSGGRAQIVTIEGDAGTGKSRLVEEVKKGRKQDEVGWLEGHAFPYAQDTPYFPVVDLLSRRFEISDTDSVDQVRLKVECGVASLTGEGAGIKELVGSLFELDYPELANIQPDAWRPRLHDAVFRLLSAMALERPTVILLEDLHWADSATIELVRYVMEQLRQPALFLVTFRPGFQVDLDADATRSGAIRREIRLEELSTSEAQVFVEALLGSDVLPDGLTKFALEKAEGNPFYLEQVVNTLVESGTLLRRDGRWQLTRTLEELVVPANVQGLILARLDRLEPQARRVLQESAVIGRLFQGHVLKEVTSTGDGLDGCLRTLCGSGILRTRQKSRGLEYVFNHALTQEVVYGSLLRGDRRELHERIGGALERLYPGRLLEFCETLAFHFQRGSSSLKAVDYLIKAGDKSWRRYALGESHRYFGDAFEILSRPDLRSEQGDALLLDVLNKWAIVYNHLGDYRALSDLLERHEDMARSVAATHPKAAALLFGWLGYALQCRERLDLSYRYLAEALEMVQDGEDAEATAYVSAWMARTCVDMGRLDEALVHGHRAEEFAGRLEPDSKLYRFVYSALGLAYYFRGEREPLDRVATALLQYGEEHTDLRSLLLGHVNRGSSYLIAGEFDEARDAYTKGINVSVDPMYSMYARLMLGVTHASAGNLEDAERTLTEVIDFDRSHGFDLLGTTARGMMSIVLLSRGELAEGVSVAEEVMRSYREGGNRYRHALQEYMLGRVYLRLALREGGGGLAFLAKNVGFLVKNVPHARALARQHLEAAARNAREIGARGVLGQALMDLGRLSQASGERQAAQELLAEAVTILEGCGATAFAEQARCLREGVGVPT